GAHLKATFGDQAEKRLSYFTLQIPEPVPIVPQMREISFWAKTNVPLSIKIAISPFGFIYHGPTIKPSSKWRQVSVKSVYDELAAWCRKGHQDARNGFVSGIIVAVHDAPNVTADIMLDDFAVSGAEGFAQAVSAERFRRKVRRVRVSVVSQVWSDEGRRLEAVLEKLDEAGTVGSDIVLLPQECVKTGGEAIPGPLSEAIAAKAKQYQMYVIGNLRERDGDKTYVTSFLCDRSGAIVGKYRKSHKMPDEDMDLGDDLPVFDTDFGPIAMRIGTDRFFPDIDHVYTVKGARIIFWSQMPEPVEDEFSQDFPSAGRAADYGVHIACARYAFKGPGWITNKYPPYCGCPIGRAYVINKEGQRIASTPRSGGVATAVIPLNTLTRGRGAPRKIRGFATLTAPVKLPEEKQWAKRRIRVTIIESHLGIDDLLKKLDEAGKMGSDIVCLYEFVWIHGPDKQRIEKETPVAKQRLAKVAAKAKQWGMYVLIAGVVDRIERNEAILFGRDGREVGRYFKIAKTHDEQITGDDTPVFETDFGRVAARICADEWNVELDRCYAIKGADILFTPTQSWGPDALFRDLRDISRAMDAGLFLVECTHPSTEVRHRSVIVEPTGVVVARSEYRRNSIVSAVIDLDNDRPLRYIRKYKPHKPVGYLPQYQPDRMPEAANDLRETILAQRRPELYGVLSVNRE
ncbi:MAG: carbon-nitrogen hydrolase family protein, partial [Armatimonadota bacterium]